ncbi:hypothetical protein AMTR_s00141p00090530 [Amborella trichopoda]|uniref:Uncharacterized protein n=1 Tax=Amborella trichopoda TaxID=13333 RepID=W1PH35_AMBTC|nr:hypothetical protein AMTR_s00141p00090530 [Amborella trichopoda]
MTEGSLIISGAADDGRFEHHEATASGDEGPSPTEEKEPVLREKPAVVAEGESPDSIQGETPKEFNGMSFEVAPLKAAIDMALVSLEVAPSIEVTPFVATSTMVPSVEVVSIPDSSMIVARGSDEPGMAEDMLCMCLQHLKG